MEFLLFIALIVIFVAIINIKTSQRIHAEELKKNLSTLNKQLQDIKSQLSAIEPAAPKPEILSAEQQQKENEAAALKAQEEYKQKIAAIEALRQQREAKRKQEEEKQLQESSSAAIIAINQNTEVPQIKVQPAPLPPKESWTEKWSRNNPDLEKFIGENLVSKIGIAVLVLAIGFFVKYAIDQNWIGPVGRVSIGILCGGILIALAHRMRNNYKAFSSVLAGGGLAVFYFTITLAFHQFHLFSHTVAFIIMVVITAFAAVLSLLYNRQELAVITLVGGFAAPFLVSTGEGNYKVLFTYLIILNSGLLIISYNKAWRILNLLSFIFTVFIYGNWLLLLPMREPYIVPPVTYKNGLAFAGIFYLLFFVINIAHNIKEKKKFIASDFGILLVNTCLFFAAGLHCLEAIKAVEYKGLFSASMAIFNLAASYFLFRKQKVDTNILYLLIGITLTFISITAPLQLNGNYITLFWASEAVLLYWLYIRSGISIMRYSATLVWMLMMISLVMDWLQLYTSYNTAVTIIANKGFITTVFAAVATYLLFILRNKEPQAAPVVWSRYIPHKNVFRITAVVLLFNAGALEINYQFSYYFPGENFHVLYLLLYTLAFFSILSLITQKMQTLRVNWQTIVAMLAAGIVFYFMSIPQTVTIQRAILEQHKHAIHFTAHWVGALLALVVLYQLMQTIRHHKTFLQNSIDFSAWIICAAFVTLLSTEMFFICNHFFYAADNPLENIQRIFIKTGLPILWGLSSFSFMWLGMRYKYRTLRIISLSLFSLTLLKLFIFDIRNIPAGGKIAAFFCLGVLLLVVSFMYQRLKKIIIDDEKKVD